MHVAAAFGPLDLRKLFELIRTTAAAPNAPTTTAPNAPAASAPDTFQRTAAAAPNAPANAPATATTAGATAARNVAAVTVTTTTGTSPTQVANSVDFNEIASINTTSKRDAFLPLQQATHRAIALGERLEKAEALRDAAKTKHAADPSVRNQAALDRAEKGVKDAEKAVSDQQKQVDQAGAKLKTWLTKNGVSHNEELKALNAEKKSLTAQLAKARSARSPDAALIQGLETKLEWNGHQRANHTAYLQSKIESFEPVTDRRFQRHAVNVGGRSVHLEDNIVTYATTSSKGMNGSAAGDTRATVDAKIRASSISSDAKAVLEIVSKHEGTFSKMNTWDSAAITFGFIQWTSNDKGTGSLVGLMGDMKRKEPAAYREAFQKYGIDVDRGQLTLTQADGTVLKGKAAVDAIQYDPKYVAILSAAGMDPKLQDVQIEHAARTKIHNLRSREVKLGDGTRVKVSDYVTSDRAVGLMADRGVHGGEGTIVGYTRNGTYVAGPVELAVEAYRAKNPGADIESPAAKAAIEADVIARLYADDPRRGADFDAFDATPGSYR